MIVEKNTIRTFDITKFVEGIGDVKARIWVFEYPNKEYCGKNAMSLLMDNIVVERFDLPFRSLGEVNLGTKYEDRITAEFFVPRKSLELTSAGHFVRDDKFENFHKTCYEILQAALNNSL